MYGLNHQKATKLDGNDTITLSHHPYIFCHFADLQKCSFCLIVVCSGGLWKAVGWVVLGVKCMLMCTGNELHMLWVAAM